MSYYNSGCNPCGSYSPCAPCSPCGPCSPCSPYPYPYPFACTGSCMPCNGCDPCGYMPCNCYKCRKSCDKPCKKSCKKPCKKSCNKPCCKKTKDYDSESYASSSASKSCGKKKRCNKCQKSNCCCINYCFNYSVDCGCIAISLTKVASPTTYSAVNDTITYTYTITNMGSVPICYPVRIMDSLLGGQIVPCAFIAPFGGTQVFVRTYAITIPDMDQESITNTATAFVEVDCNTWVMSAPVSATVTRVLL